MTSPNFLPIPEFEIFNSNSKVLFHVSERGFDNNIVITDSRKLLSNGDGSVRINIPREIFDQFISYDAEYELFIRLEDESIIFDLVQTLITFTVKYIAINDKKIIANIAINLSWFFVSSFIFHPFRIIS